MDDTEPTAAQPAEPTPTVVEPVAAEHVTAPAAERPRLRDLVFGLRSLIVVAVAGVIIGGLAGFGIHAATDGDGPDGRMGRFGPGGGFRGGPEGGFGGGPGQGWGQGPGQGPGQVGPGGPMGGPGTQQLPPQGGTQPQPTQPPAATPTQSS
jgi:hypothetical protein